MSGQSTLAPEDRQVGQQELVRLTISPDEQDQMWELCRDIERLGGVEQEEGYAFASGTVRDEAAEILIDTWGAGYFESINTANDSQMRILVAVSEAERGKEFGKLLRKEGFSVEVVSDETGALEMMRIHRPHALVIDQALLFGANEELLAYLSSSPRFRWLMVVVVGEHSSEAILHKSELPQMPRFVVSDSFENVLNTLQTTLESKFSTAV